MGQESFAYICIALLFKTMWLCSCKRMHLGGGERRGGCGAGGLQHGGTGEVCPNFGGVRGSRVRGGHGALTFWEAQEHVLSWRLHI